MRAEYEHTGIATGGLTGFAPASDCVRAEYEHTGSNRVNRVCPSLPTVREEYGLIGTTGLKLIVSLFYWVFNVKKSKIKYIILKPKYII